MAEYKKVQQNEVTLTSKIQSLNWIDSFANEILTKKPEIKKSVDKLKIAQFSGYSGIKQSGYLGKFFYIARYVDEVEKDNYMVINPDQKKSPIAKIKEQNYVFDKKPWNVDWEKIPMYTKDHIRLHYTELGKNDNIQFKKQDYGTQTSDDYNKYILDTIGEKYDRKDKMQKLAFMQSAATVGTGTPIVQAQNNAKTYIQGYIMNILELDSSNENVEKYYKEAVENGMGLLSGPSGTAHRVSNLVREIYGKGYDIKTKIKTAALCLAALGSPYNCHSFYEIVTVILPEDTKYHKIDNFDIEIDKIKK